MNNQTCRRGLGRVNMESETERWAGLKVSGSFQCSMSFLCMYDLMCGIWLKPHSQTHPITVLTLTLSFLGFFYLYYPTPSSSHIVQLSIQYLSFYGSRTAPRTESIQTTFPCFPFPLRTLCRTFTSTYAMPH